MLCALISDPDHYSHSVSSTTKQEVLQLNLVILGTLAVPVQPAKVSVWGEEFGRSFLSTRQ